jgi:hypothetical protein
MLRVGKDEAHLLYLVLAFDNVRLINAQRVYP